MGATVVNSRVRRFRFLFIAGAFIVCGVGLILVSLQDSLFYFTTPQDLHRHALGHKLRLGGLVVEGSIRQGDVLQFRVSDAVTEVAVTYAGVVPSLFRSGQGVVLEGHRTPEGFTADVLFVKHDERYMPRPLVNALKEQGQWRS